MLKIAGGFLKYRYLLLSLVVVLLIVFRSTSDLWVGDFWEHSAVVRELATHPLYPEHPQLLSPAPHAFYSPYALVMGFFSRLTGLSAIETLALAGMANLLLLLVGLYAFVAAVAPQNPVGSAYYALLLFVFFWGWPVWNYSGFFQLRNLGFVLPYPSTFALAITLVGLVINAKRLKQSRDLLLLPIFFIAVLVLLTHQLTFLLLAAGLAAFSLQAGEKLWQEWLRLAALLGLSFGAAVLWPYYPFWQLLRESSAVYHAANQVMYQHVFLRTWPALLAIPLLVIELRRDWRRPLPWMFILLLLVYVIGGLTGAYSYGRVVSFLVYILDIILAIELARIESKLRWPFTFPAGNRAVFSLGVAAVLILFAYKPFISGMLDFEGAGEASRYEKYYFLSQYTGQYDVILADISLAPYVPVFGGKVVAYYRPLAFVPDQAERAAAVAQFFAPGTSQAERQQIIDRYQVKYILLEKTEASNWEASRALIAPLSELVYRGKRFLLYEVD